MRESRPTFLSSGGRISQPLRGLPIYTKGIAVGAWDIGSFENDDALDWVAHLDKAHDTSILLEAFSSVLQSGSYLETPKCCEALAAAEVVAALRHRPAPKLPMEVPAFVARIAALPSPELLLVATQAIERVKTKSELRELWDDSSGAKDWLDDVSNLQERLA
jgi:hypothetical protein